MRFWQRAITIIMLMVFAPASVLAGTPLRICTGSDGHRAIEFVLSADHHHADEEAVDMAKSSVTAVSAPMHCSDSPLLNASQKPVRSAEKKFTPQPDELPPVAVLAVPGMQAAYRTIADAKHQAPLSSLCVTSQLDALKTVVLLI